MVIPRWQDVLGRSLMALSSLGALVAFYGAIASVRAAAADTVWVETWRMFGFLVFAGLFALLAARPRLSAGVWELVFFDKAAMGVSMLLLPGAKDAVSAGSVDAVLAVLIAIAYVCTRGWRSWRAREPRV